MPLTETFYDFIEEGDITPDAAQSRAIVKFEKIHEEILRSKEESLSQNSEIESKRSWGFFSSFFNKDTNKGVTNSIKGMYIWGDVGRGKTWLMDQFYDSLSIKKKERIHFHQLMQQVHAQLELLPSQPDPLVIIGTEMSRKYRLICLDEFHVMDIADAVILHGLLKALFEGGVTLITTSNRDPDDLYKDGSRRERFLPAIALIKEYTHVFHLDSGKDYRLHRKHREDTFFIPHDAVAQKKLSNFFIAYSLPHEPSSNGIKIEGREIPVIKSSPNCIWFDFDTLCRGMRASTDYIAIAEQYKVIIITEIPVLKEGEEGPARRFLNLIDAFYDQHVFLLLSSTEQFKNMYKGKLLGFEFERALSRLDEMQSKSWWGSFDKSFDQNLGKSS